MLQSAKIRCFLGWDTLPVSMLVHLFCQACLARGWHEHSRRTRWWCSLSWEVAVRAHKHDYPERRRAALSEPQSGVITILFDITVASHPHVFLPVVQVYTRGMAPIPLRIFRVQYCRHTYTSLNQAQLSHGVISLSIWQSIKHILNIIVPYFIPRSLMHTCVWTQSLQLSKCFTSRYFTCLGMSFYIPDYI